MSHEAPRHERDRLIVVTLQASDRNADTAREQLRQGQRAAWHISKLPQDITQHIAAPLPAGGIDQLDAFAHTA